MDTDDNGTPDEKTTEEQLTIALSESEDAFTAEFNRESDGDADIYAEVPATAVITGDAEEGDPIIAAGDLEVGPADDPDVVAKDEPTVEEQMAEMRKAMRKIQGKNGELNAKLQKLSEAQTAPEIKKTLEELLAENPKMGYMKEEFQEMYESQQAAAEITRQSIMDDLPAGLSPEETKAMIDRGVLEVVHVGWQDTVKSEDFLAFAYQGGPSAEEVKEYLTAKRANDPESDIMFNTFMDQYPEWGDSKGRLLNSSYVSDAKNLLDQYEDHRSAPARKAQINKTRLSKNVAATKSSSEGQAKRRQTAEEAFEEGFKNG